MNKNQLQPDNFYAYRYKKCRCEHAGGLVGYDSEQALHDARDAFWHGGYSGTSLDALSEATGMNRPSLYGAFGDKHALYLDTLDQYIELGRQGMEAALPADQPLAERIIVRV